MRLSRLLTTTALIMLTLSPAHGAPAAYGDGGSEYPIPEKASPTYPNLGSHLDNLATSIERRGSNAKEAGSGAPFQQQEPIAVTIYLSGNVTQVTEFIEENGGSPRNVGQEYIEAYVPVSLLGQVSEQSGVLRVRKIPLAIPAQTPPRVIGHGPAQHFSQAWNLAGITGRGIKVGIGDTGFQGFRDLMGTELPMTVKARCYTSIGRFTDNLDDCENGNDHGTLVAESLIDIAPEASLYIATGVSPGDAKANIDWMLSQGVSVINKSTSWPFDGPGDGTSPFPDSPLKTVDHAIAEGAVWLNSAGNEGQSAWLGPFSDPDSNRYHNFDGDIEATVLPLQAGEPFTIELRWEDTWGQPETDLDLHIYHSDREFFAAMEDYQTGPNASDFPIPSELGSFEVSEEDFYDIVIWRASGPAPEWVQLIAHSIQPLSIRTGGSIVNPAESANPGMLAVGASPWYDVYTIEPTSSRGPTPDGRVKPDIVGVDCGETASAPLNEYGEGFCGTSQASPHVAGLAALVRQRFPEYTPVQVADYLKDSTYQFGTPDPNNTWGYGLAALRLAVPPDAPTVVMPITAGPDWLSVAWKPPATGFIEPITSYTLRHIRADMDETVESNWTIAEDAGSPDSQQHRLTGLTAGTPYGVQARGVNYWGKGEWSATANGVTGPPVAPGQVTGLKAGLSDDGVQVALSWTAPASSGGSPITGYQVESSVGDGDPWVEVITTDGNGTTYTDMGDDEHGPIFGEGALWHYRVAAVNAVGTGPFSLPVPSGDPLIFRYDANATRSFNPATVGPGGEVVVTIAATGYGSLGTVTETLPVGFSYESSSLTDEGEVTEVDARTVRFTLQGADKTFTYTITASSVGGPHTFSGVLRDSDRNGHKVGCPCGVAVTDVDEERTLLDRYDANPKNGMIDLDEVFKAIDDYFDYEDRLTLEEVFEIVDLYFDS